MDNIKYVSGLFGGGLLHRELHNEFSVARPLSKVVFEVTFRALKCFLKGASEGLCLCCC